MTHEFKGYAYRRAAREQKRRRSARDCGVIDWRTWRGMLDARPHQKALAASRFATKVSTSP